MESVWCAGGLFFLAVLTGILLFGAGLYYLITRFFVSSSGLGRLMEAYPAPMTPAGPLLRRQTIRLGPVRWRRCVNIAVAPEGLYLEVRQTFTNFKPLLIPWEQIQPAGETLLYWQRAMRLAIGEPAITNLVIFPDLYQAMRPYLRV